MNVLTFLRSMIVRQCMHQLDTGTVIYNIFDS
jgi:hypothetical protein